MRRPGWLAGVFLLALPLLAACRGGVQPVTSPASQEGPSPRPAVTSRPTSKPTPRTPTPVPATQEAPSTSALSIMQVSDNRASYPESQVPAYSRLEITFQIENSVAGNLQLPYDPSPPPGIDLTYPRHQGISVDAHFSPDNWQTVYSQPAFYYQAFEEEVRDGGPWYYPSDQFAWKARFAPPTPGAWQYRITARDASGLAETPPVPFTVTASPSHGFIRVSETDPRYFEFDDGTPFHALGLNLGLRWLDDSQMAQLGQNGIQLVRTWLAPASIFGSAWNPYYEGRNNYNGYVPRSGLLPFFDTVTGRETIKLRLDWDPDGNTGWFDACRVVGRWGTPTEVRPNTRYRIQIVYRGIGISGPRVPGFADYGLVVKTDLPSGTECFEPGAGTVLTPYGGDTPDSWGVLEGEWFSGQNAFLPPTYLGLENASGGQVYIDSVSLRELLSDGEPGPEVMHKPSMEHHLYFQQRNSYALDKILEAAERHGVYLKPVILEKGEKIFQKINFEGQFAPDNREFFYGDWREVNKVRWLQQAWWRYLQARWGYSPNIHSWELLNEGDPGSGRHFALADELGKYMHCQVFGQPVGREDGQTCNYDYPNAHLVTTSLWHSFPADVFWANPNYPNVDYADVHAYISTGWLDDPAHEGDAAAYHIDYSRATRQMLDTAFQGRATRPIVRGEAGIDYVDSQSEQPGLKQDRNGVWLHNLLWSSVEPGGLIEQYWWTQNIQSLPGPDGQTGLYEVFGYFYDFLQGIPLTNGHYQGVTAQASNPGLRVVGQIDPLADRAHLWVQNRAHTWPNAIIVDPRRPYGLGGTLAVRGFTPDTDLAVQWHEFTTLGIPSLRTSTARSDASGTLVLSLPADPAITDAGIRIQPP